jgi:hypothetical protein
MAANGDRKSTGSNFGCALRCEFFPHSFSQSSSEGIFQRVGDFLEWLNGSARFDKRGA